MRNPAPTLAEVIELRERAPGSLESAAASINRHIDLFVRAEASYSAHRMRAGFELIAVRKRIPHGDWENWCADNINRSMRDIQRLIKMAGDDNPAAAFERERAAVREGMASSRSKATNVSRISDRANVSAVSAGSAVERLFQLFLQLDEAEREEFLARVKGEMER